MAYFFRYTRCESLDKNPIHNTTIWLTKLDANEHEVSCRDLQNFFSTMLSSWIITVWLCLKIAEQTHLTRVFVALFVHRAV